MTSTLRTPWSTASTDGKSSPRRSQKRAPLPLDDGARIHERAVEVEEQRRHTRIRAAFAGDAVDGLLARRRGRRRRHAAAAGGARHAHLVDVVQVDEQPVGAIRLAARDEQLRRVARQVPPAHVAGHDDVEPALERGARGELERERADVAPRVHVRAKTLPPPRDDLAVHADLDLRAGGTRRRSSVRMICAAK